MENTVSTYRSAVGNMLIEALITEVEETLPMVTKMEARATVEAEELDQYMPMAQEPAVNKEKAVK